MSSYDKAVENLLQAIKQHDSVRYFQKAEQKIKAFPELEQQVDKMKAYQQEAVLYQKIDKQVAKKKLANKRTSCKKTYQNCRLSKIIGTKCKMPVIWYNILQIAWKQRLTRS